MKRVGVLVSYFSRDLFRSWTGVLAIAGALVFYLVAIASVIGDLDRDYYALVIGGFFGFWSLLLTVLLADRAHCSTSYMILYRLPARAAFLAAVTLTAVLVTGILEIAVALFSLPRLEAPVTASMAMDLLPVWVAWLALGAGLGLHMSELVRRGWSRTALYGLLALVLFVLSERQGGAAVGLVDRLSWIPSFIVDPGRWEWLFRAVDVLIWPLAAAVRVARAVPYTVLESLSPALTLLLAAVFYGLAASLFNSKDLILPDG